MATSARPDYLCLIGGKREPASSGAWLESFDPSCAEPWARVPRCDSADVARAAAAAHAALREGAWPTLTPTQRGTLLRRFSELVRRDADTLAALETRDNGKLITEMRAQVRSLASWYEYFGGLADKIEGRVLPRDRENMLAFTQREPVGVVGLVTPWNSPLLLLSWKLAPALAAGCTVVIKPSEHASISTLAFVSLFEEAGFPPGVVNAISGLGEEAGAALAANPLIDKLAFTGGEDGGRAAALSMAMRLRPMTLELGGKSANIVFEDANFDNAVRGAIAGIFAASGQTCIAGSRLLIQDGIHDRFVDALRAMAATARMGDPAETTTQVGPVTTRAQYERVLKYISVAREEGAHCILGGGPGMVPGHAGWYVQPTIFTGVRNSMRIAREEVFGPVLAVIRFRDEAEALAIANDSPYGLAAGVWTRDMGRALRMSQALQAGTVWVNTYRAVSYLAPFGGCKDSGYGRENGQEAINEYLRTKSTWLNTAADFPDPFVLQIG